MTGTLECKSISLTLGSWQTDYSCVFGSSEWHVLCGSSGAGKSTLLNLILGLIRPQSGEILIDGKNIADQPPHRRNISYMSQANSLFPTLSIMENFKLALHDQNLTETQSLSQIALITENLKIHPTLLDRLPSSLSGGELSRCNLARALLRPCRWLMLDEPFSAVDRPTRLSILGWLKQWQAHSDLGIILVSHDLDDIYTVASHVTVVSNGTIVENAPIRNALEQPSHKLTAKILRAGVIVETNRQSCFISSKNIYLNRARVACDDDFVGEIPLQKPHITQIGNTLRIIELTSGIDISLPSEESFSGSLWFDNRHQRELRD